LDESMTSVIQHVAVLIPARDEEELLPRCLESIVTAASLLPTGVSFDIVVAVDRSTDRTYDVATAMLGDRGSVLHSNAGVVGCARALAAKCALQRFAGSRRRCWLANTDADCSVPEKWLIDQLSLAGDTVEAIAGTVEVDTFSEHRAGVAESFRSAYQIQPDGTHSHVHGANLGVRADAYVRVGGWRDLATAEDHDLWNRIARANCERMSVGWLKVLTSGRRVGRAPHGFAEALGAHNEAVA
jgi:glycosyltransferase involved in cell wall biosynthesis